MPDRLTARELILELKGRRCRCGASKNRGHTFCVNCYYKLPIRMRQNLYRIIGDGYAMAYQAAVRYLDEETK